MASSKVSGKYQSSMYQSKWQVASTKMEVKLAPLYRLHFHQHLHHRIYHQHVHCATPDRIQTMRVHQNEIAYKVAFFGKTVLLNDFTVIGHWTKFTILAMFTVISPSTQSTLLFLAVQNSSIGDIVTDSLTHSLTGLLLLILQSDPRELVTFETFVQSDEKTLHDQKN